MFGLAFSLSFQNFMNYCLNSGSLSFSPFGPFVMGVVVEKRDMLYLGELIRILYVLVFLCRGEPYCTYFREKIFIRFWVLLHQREYQNNNN